MPKVGKNPGGRVDVAAALSVLSENERAAIVLAVFGRHSCREVAATMGASLTAVQKDLRSGLFRLAGVLDLATSEPAPEPAPGGGARRSRSPR